MLRFALMTSFFCAVFVLTSLIGLKSKEFFIFLCSVFMSLSFVSSKAFPAASKLIFPEGDIVLGSTAGSVISLLSKNE